MTMLTGMAGILLLITFGGREGNSLPPWAFQHWIHSHEEDRAGTEVFRSARYPFPPARGRTGFELKQSGEFIEFRIGSDDRLPEEVRGKWELKERSKIYVELGRERRSYVLYIVSLETDSVRLRRE